jgi:hypothetical protein
MNRDVRISPIVPLVLTALALASCGAGDAATIASSKEKTPDWSKYPPGPTRQFIIPGADNAVQTFGHEGTVAEWQAASRLINFWLRARAAKNWAEDCSYFSRDYAEHLTEEARGVTKGRVKTCPQALAFFKGKASGNFVDTLDAEIDSLRVGRGQGIDETQHRLAFAQYHGNDGKDWIVPLEWENGEWKVSKAAPINRLR